MPSSNEQAYFCISLTSCPVIFLFLGRFNITAHQEMCLYDKKAAVISGSREPLGKGHHPLIRLSAACF